MAEEIFNQQARDVSAHATSAGLDATAGSPINPHAEEALNGLGYGPTEHSSELLSIEAVEAADVILTFTQSQKIELGQRFTAADGKVFTISEYANSGLSEIEDVPDPYGKSEAVYQETAETIASLVKVIVGSLKNS
jgi:protein-tyrosine-phosphatase